MRIRYLSGPFTGDEETVEQVPGEVMVQFGYAERVPDWPPPESPAVAPPVALVEEPPADPPPPSGAAAAAPSPSPAGGPLFDP